MRQSLKLVTLLVILFYFSRTSAQIELENKVVDFATLMPLESASIYIKNTTIGTISNADGKFLLVVPDKNANDSLVVSSIGYKSFKTLIKDFDATMEIFLEEDIASLDEVILVAENRPKTGNDIVLRALEELPETLPDSSYLQKGFIRHKERNKRQFKWLVEAAITMYDGAAQDKVNKKIKINVDEMRKSYDLRDVDSLLTYTSFLKNNYRGLRFNAKELRRDTIRTSSLVKAIKWNDTRVNGLNNLFNGKLNPVRNYARSNALFGKDVLAKHYFKLDTVLVENDRKIYKVKIAESREFIDLKTKGIYNGGLKAEGWIYIYWDNFAIKRLEYNLVAASDSQKRRSKTLFDTDQNHKLIINYMEYNDRMYTNYMYYETPKLVNVGSGSKDKNATEYELLEERENRFYSTVQEIVFTEIIDNQEDVKLAKNKTWDPDLFKSMPYNEAFWKNYNTLLESEEEEQLIEDLTRRSSLFKN
jgi:hypothetical protein